MRRRPPVALPALVAAVLAAAWACHNPDEFQLTPGLVERTLELLTEGGRTTLPADGVSRLRLMARISPNADPDKRTIAFSTSAGTLVGGSAGSDGERQVEADGEGEALIELQSSLVVEDAVVRARVTAVPGLTRQLVVSFVAADPDTVIRFVAAPASAPADGATTSAFTVAISPALPLGTAVTFTSTLGAFAPENAASVSRQADGSFRASADLVSPPTLGTARIRATANQVTREALIDFFRALPNRITVATDAPTVGAAATASVRVTATFLRDIGDVTEGTVATFAASDATGAALGSFRNVTVVAASGTSRQASADFTPLDTAFRGRATITVGAAGSAVTGTATVEIVDP